MLGKEIDLWDIPKFWLEKRVISIVRPAFPPYSLEPVKALCWKQWRLRALGDYGRLFKAYKTLCRSIRIVRIIELISVILRYILW